MLPREAASIKQILLKRIPGIAAASRLALREEFGRIVFLHLSLGVIGQHEAPNLSQDSVERVARVRDGNSLALGK